MSRGLRPLMRAVIRKSELDTVVKTRDDFKIVYFFFFFGPDGGCRPNCCWSIRVEGRGTMWPHGLARPASIVQKRIHDDGNAERCENVARPSKIRFRPDEYIGKQKQNFVERTLYGALSRTFFAGTVHCRYRPTRSSPKRTVL